MKAVLDLARLLGAEFEDAPGQPLVVGEPIESGPFTLVVISRVSVVLAGREPRQGGLAARLRPVGVAVLGPEGVEIKPIPHPEGPVETLLDQLPAVLERVQRWGEERK